MLCSHWPSLSFAIFNAVLKLSDLSSICHVPRSVPGCFFLHCKHVAWWGGGRLQVNTMMFHNDVSQQSPRTVIGELSCLLQDIWHNALCVQKTCTHTHSSTKVSHATHVVVVPFWKSFLLNAKQTGLGWTLSITENGVHLRCGQIYHNDMFWLPSPQALLLISHGACLIGYRLWCRHHHLTLEIVHGLSDLMSLLLLLSLICYFQAPVCQHNNAAGLSPACLGYQCHIEAWLVCRGIVTLAPTMHVVMAFCQIQSAQWHYDLWDFQHAMQAVKMLAFNCCYRDHLLSTQMGMPALPCSCISACCGKAISSPDRLGAEWSALLEP